MYLRCSMQYFFRYIEGLRDKPSFSLAIGKGGHAALEKSTKRKITTGLTNSADEVVQWASDFMDQELTALPPSEYEKDIAPGEAKDKFLAATRIFQTRDAPGMNPIGAEIEFNLDMNEFQPEPLETPIRVVNGKIDILYDDLGTRVVHEPGLVRLAVEDFKFVGKKRNVNEVNLSPQLSLYATVIKKLTGSWPTKIGYRMFTPGTKTSGPDAIVLSREPEYMTGAALDGRMRRLAFQFRQVEQGIRAGIFIPTDDPKVCSWCGFRDRCQSSLVTDIESVIIRSNTNPPT